MKQPFLRTPKPSNQSKPAKMWHPWQGGMSSGNTFTSWHTFRRVIFLFSQPVCHLTQRFGIVCKETQLRIESIKPLPPTTAYERGPQTDGSHWDTHWYNKAFHSSLIKQKQTQNEMKQRQRTPFTTAVWSGSRGFQVLWDQCNSAYISVRVSCSLWAKMIFVIKSITGPDWKSIH